MPFGVAGRRYLVASGGTEGAYWLPNSHFGDQENLGDKILEKVFTILYRTCTISYIEAIFDFLIFESSFFGYGRLLFEHRLHLSAEQEQAIGSAQ